MKHFTQLSLARQVYFTSCFLPRKRIYTTSNFLSFIPFVYRPLSQRAQCDKKRKRVSLRTTLRKNNEASKHRKKMLKVGRSKFLRNQFVRIVNVRDKIFAGSTMHWKSERNVTIFERGKASQPSLAERERERGNF